MKTTFRFSRRWRELDFFFDSRWIFFGFRIPMFTLNRRHVNAVVWSRALWLVLGPFGLRIGPERVF